MATVEQITELGRAKQNKQWDKVKFYAQEVLEQEPDDVYAIQAIGNALEKQGFVDEALQHYEQAMVADKKSDIEIGHSRQTFFLRRLDILYHRAGRYEDCLRVCKYYTKQQQSNRFYFQSWDAWNRLRRAAQKTGNMELSLAAKERADAIKVQREAEERAKEAEYQQWRREAEERAEEAGCQLWPEEKNGIDDDQPSVTTDEDLADLDDPEDLARLSRKLEILSPFLAELLNAKEAD